MGGAIAARAAAGGVVKSLVGLAVIDVVEGKTIRRDRRECTSLSGLRYSHGLTQLHAELPEGQTKDVQVTGVCSGMEASMACSAG